MRAVLASLLLVGMSGLALAQEAAPALQPGKDCIIGEPGCPDPTQDELNRPNVAGDAPGGQVPPQGAVPADQAQPHVRALTPQEYDKLREEMKNGAIGAIFTPEEIIEMRRRKLEAQAAGKRPYLGQAPTTKGRVVQYPPRNDDEGVPFVTLAGGLVTPVTVTDAGGKPWPIKRWDYDTRALSIEGSPCGQEGGGSGGGQVPLFDNQRPYVISVMPCNWETYANLVLYLEGKTTPVVVMMQSGSFDRADMPVRIAVDGKSPGVGGRTVVARAAPAAPRKKVRESQTSPDPLFGNLLEGYAPKGVERLQTDGSAAAYLANGRMYLVCNCEPQNPPHDAQGEKRDGSVKVYRFNEPVGRVLVMDSTGVERPIGIDY